MQLGTLSEFVSRVPDQHQALEHQESGVVLRSLNELADRLIPNRPRNYGCGRVPSAHGNCASMDAIKQ